MKQFIRKIIQPLGYDIVRAGVRRDVMDFIRDRAIDTVLDVGANEGQFARLLRDQGYAHKIISFEPIPTVFQLLAAAAQSDPKWEVHNFGLGAETGQATINISNLTTFSSVLPIKSAATEFAETAAVTRTEVIELRTLDEAVPSVAPRTLLKIDTQGLEKQVLSGACNTLPLLMGVLMELPIIQLYEGAWTLQEAITFMEQAGFIPAQFHVVNYHSKDPVSMVEVDCLFRLRNPVLDG